MKTILNSMATALIAGLIAATGFVTEAAAQTNESVGAKRDWSIFKQGAADQRQCWIVTQPLTSTAKRGGQPVSVNRGDIFLMIAIRPGGGVKNEVSFMAGYPFKKSASVKLKIGSASFELFTDGEAAWTDSGAQDDKVVGAMKRGAKAVVSGVSSRGTTTTDTFSLLGFTAALTEARALCK